MRHRLLFASLLVALVPGARATESPPPAGPPALHVAFERYRLPNGLTVILHENHRSPEVTVNLWFRVGSKDERAGRTGFAHLFEHLMFMGTRAVPNGQFDAIMEAAGGQNNASTTEDRTNYFEAGPSNLLETFLWLEADRIATLADDMTRDKVKLQVDVVKNERRQSYENRPYGKVELILPEHLFPPGHPYHHPVIGSHKDLSAASATDVKAFFHAYYAASNASLVIAGDFAPAEAKRLVEKYFAPLPAEKTPPHATPPAVSLAKSEKVVLRDAVELARTEEAWLSPSAFSPGDAEAELLAAVIGGGKSSRLYQALVYRQKLAEAVEVEQRGMQFGGELVVTATAQEGHDADELARALDEEIGRLVSGAAPITDGELSRAKAFVETQVLREAEKTMNMADLLNAFEFYFGDPGELEKRLLSRYEAVTAPGLTQAAAALLGRPHFTAQVVPEKGGKK